MMQNPEKLFHTKCPVGIESRARDVISALRLDDSVFRVVVIHGISGSGKTTIVKYVYDRIALDFEYRCFIEDVSGYEDMWGQRWKYELQKDVISCVSSNRESTIIGSNTNGVAKILKLIMGRKVLLVIDGVQAYKHLEALGIHHASFSSLSRIIVTTTNKESVVNLPCTPYDLRLLDTRESFELFVGLTFRKDDHVDEMFVQEVVCCADGLPLVLDVWSRHFKCFEKKYWRSILEKLKRIPHEDIQKKLQVSYDSLNKTSQKLFLDIACFFIYIKKNTLVKILQDDASRLFFPEIEIQHLTNKGLVKLDNNTCVSLHEVIKEMGQEVARQENEDEPQQRRRLTDDRDIARVFEDCLGTDSVESIRWRPKELIYVKFEALRKMSNLRLLDFDGDHISWLCDMSPLCFERMKFVSWSFFPLKSLDMFHMDNLVVLELWNSKLEILWDGMKNFKKLKILRVTNSKSLTRTGDFSGLENLEELWLPCCTQLEELHESISKLHKLWVICLDDCAKLESIPNLPPNIKILRAYNCKSLLNLPSNMCELEFLNQLRLNDCLKLEHHSLKKVSSVFKDLFITRELIVTLSVAKIPDWCSFQNLRMGDVLSIVVPTNMDNKICGVILCATIEFGITKMFPFTYFKMRNRTKTICHRFVYHYGSEGSRKATFYPFGYKTFMVEAGDLVQLEFQNHTPNSRVTSGGLRLIYEDDLSDYALLIQNAYS